MKSYLITDRVLYGNSSIEFEKNLRQVYKNHRVNFSCFRDKESQNLDELIKVFIEISREFKIENILINSYIDLAIKYRADGVHLPSSMLDKIDYAKSRNLFIVSSTHNLEEIKRAKNSDAITYSPIFQTPNKGNPKGLKELKKIVNSTSLRVFALGGVKSDIEIEKLKEANPYGFASIRYFI